MGQECKFIRDKDTEKMIRLNHNNHGSNRKCFIFFTFASHHKFIHIICDHVLVITEICDLYLIHVKMSEN